MRFVEERHLGVLRRWGRALMLAMVPVLLVGTAAAPAAEPFGRHSPDRQSFASYVALLEFIAQRRLTADERVYLRDDLNTQLERDPAATRQVLGWVERSLQRVRNVRDPLTRLMLHEGLRVMTYCALADAPPAARARDEALLFGEDRIVAAGCDDDQGRFLVTEDGLRAAFAFENNVATLGDVPPPDGTAREQRLQQIAARAARLSRDERDQLTFARSRLLALNLLWKERSAPQRASYATEIRQVLAVGGELPQVANALAQGEPFAAWRSRLDQVGQRLAHGAFGVTEIDPPSRPNS